MQVKAFRVQSFRSVHDSDWQDFSPDQVTVLVGQNESGKSSILEALHCAGIDRLRANLADIRTDGALPAIDVRVQLAEGELDSFLDGVTAEFSTLARTAFEGSRGELCLRTAYRKSGALYKTVTSLATPVILPGMPDELRETLSEDEKAKRSALDKEFRAFEQALTDSLPYFSLFRETASTLPDTIDLLDGDEPIKDQKGAAGARNFLRAAGLDLKAVLAADDRNRGTQIRRANKKINEELSKYWTQYFGERSRIVIDCEFGLRPASYEKPGAAYLTFWVSEGAERFYPSQRSRGTQWFVSVFLHLLAMEVEGREYVVMLDEPGSFLHATAQRDVRRLIERIAESCQVIYSTHSPELVDFDRPYRILAVERTGGGDLANTQIFRALKLSCASQETLTPILEKMGADLRHQTVIKSSGNVILEEPSALFYLRAFDLLTGKKGADLSYIAASGVNNVPTLFALLTAWGLGFCVLLDDDKQAREVRKQLIKNYFGDDEANATQKLLRLRDCDGIEDMFSPDDFVHHVLGDAFPATDGMKNSVFAKAKRVNKAVVAYRFFIRVEAGEISEKDISQETLDAFARIIESCCVAGARL